MGRKAGQRGGDTLRQGWQLREAGVGTGGFGAAMVVFSGDHAGGPVGISFFKCFGQHSWWDVLVAVVRGGSWAG